MLAIAILSISVLAFTFLLWHRNNDRQRDDVDFVPGPDSDSVLVGNMHTLISSPSDTAARAWSKQYGGLVRLHGILGVRRHALLISDPAALRQLFSTSSSFDMSSRNLSTFKTLFGPGVAGVDGPDHLRQRRIISQALTPAKVRGMLEPVQAVSKNLMAAMRTHCAQTAECTSRIDMLEWARRCALDSLTSVAFGVSLNAIDRPEQSHDILHAFDAMLEDCIGKTSAAKYFLRETAAAGIYPSLLALALVDLQFFRSMLGTSKRLGNVGRWVRSIRETLGESESGNDLLSLLEKASNEDSKYKLTDEEIQAQINMVMFAGHDTVSVTFAMFMNDMANYPEIQARLRDEILAKHAEIGGDDVPFSQDDYESMPYLNAVLKE